MNSKIEYTTKQKRKRLKKGDQFYVDGKELREELRKYLNSSEKQEERRASEKLGNFLMLIARNFASKRNFNGYSWKEEMISDGVYRILTQLDKIDLDSPKSNPFAYITKTYLHCFLTKIKEENLNLAKNRELQQLLYTDFETDEVITRPVRDSDNSYGDNELNLNNEEDPDELDENYEDEQK